MSLTICINFYNEISGFYRFPMTSIATAYRHIHLDDLQVPIVAGTTMKVVEIVVSQRAYGWSPEEIHFQYPHLSMSQIYSALAYYWDHRSDMDIDLQRRFDLVENLRQQSKISEKCIEYPGIWLGKTIISKL